MQNLVTLIRPLLASAAGLALAAAGLDAMGQTAPALPAAVQGQTSVAGPPQAPAQPPAVPGIQGGGRQGGGRGQAQAGAGFPPGQAQNAQGQNNQAQNQVQNGQGQAPGAQAGQGRNGQTQALGGRGQASGQRGQAFGAPQAGGPGRGAPAPPLASTSPDPLAQAFRAEVSAVSGEPGHMQALLVQNLGWMRSTRTLTVGGEYKEGWILASLTYNSAVLQKKGSPDKQIDLTRWSGPIPPRAGGRGGANGATQISMGSLGMPKGAGAAAQGATPPNPANAPAQAANRGGGAQNSGVQIAPAAPAPPGGANPNAGGRGGQAPVALDQLQTVVGPNGQRQVIAVNIPQPQ